jgi:hypothetical protein
VLFFGVTDTAPFNRVSFVETYDRDGLLYDDLIAGYIVPALGGDFDKNDVVDLADLAVWQAGFNGAGGAPYLNGDGDGDGDADGNDWLIWQRQVGQTSLPPEGGGAAGVPEPNALALTLVAFAVGAARRRRIQSQDGAASTKP